MHCDDCTWPWLAKKAELIGVQLRWRLADVRALRRSTQPTWGHLGRWLVLATAPAAWQHELRFLGFWKRHLPSGASKVCLTSNLNFIVNGQYYIKRRGQSGNSFPFSRMGGSLMSRISLPKAAKPGSWTGSTALLSGIGRSDIRRVTSFHNHYTMEISQLSMSPFIPLYSAA